MASDEVPPLSLGDRFVKVDCDDVVGSAESMADLAARTPVDAIVATDDAGVELAAAAAQRIGLPHSPPDAVAATVDKILLRRHLDATEINQPGYAVVGPGDDARATMETMGGPVVVKPATLSASRGVIRVDDPRDVESVVDRVRTIQRDHGVDRDRPLLIERFVPGTEIAVEASVWDGRFQVLAVFDKPEPLDGPYFEETIYVTPSREPHVEEAVELVRRTTEALGLTHGPIHAEVRIHDGRPVLIEIAARSIGGLCGRALRFGLMGSSLETLILAQALGIDASPHRQPGAAGVLMVPIPNRGLLEGFEGVEETLAIEGITGFEPATHIGDQVAPPPEDGRYLGFVFARAKAPEDVVDALVAAKGTLTPKVRAR